MRKVHKLASVWHEAGQAEDVIEWRIRNFCQISRTQNVPCVSQVVKLLNGAYFQLELFPGGRTGCTDGFVSVFLAKAHVYAFQAQDPERVDFSISVCNQLRPAETLKRTAPEMTTFPGPMGIDRNDHSARVGWNDFVKFSDLVNPSSGFLLMGEIIVKAEIHPFGIDRGALVRLEEAPPTGHTLTEAIESLFDSKSFSDAKLIVDGREFDVHRAILASRSKVFEAMFSASMTEATTNSVTVTDISAETMEILLQFIYTDSFEKTNAQPELIGDIMKAAKKYEISRLYNLCEKRALTAITLESVIDWLMLATMLEAQEIKGACMQFVTNRLPEVQLTEGWKRLLANKQLMVEVMPSMLELMCPPEKRRKCE
eukprot:gnl/TRDRNA2_/TRDRNA2_198236_c0_seq1.p1 gnl/TRDRNA2_/TRDRNA2_198236_c0~~gnl/TRDRNA2_/TRDRNA2_198236_c0_seq1.p1  ORF type:complete len:370 (-),score=71.60 gnl/TRDRNA2_/TRDRNA2_198236_c0_seq1:20-1129(-)